MHHLIDTAGGGHVEDGDSLTMSTITHEDGIDTLSRVESNKKFNHDENKSFAYHDDAVDRYCDSYTTHFDSEASTHRHNVPSSVIGREKEFQLLHDSWTETATRKTLRQQQKRTKSKIILVHGESGVGKSHFVESIRDGVVMNYDGIFLSGKFDQVSSSSSRRFPFQPIVDALGDLSDVLALSPNILEVAQCLQASLAAYEWEILTQFVSVPPDLQKLIHSVQEVEEEGGADDDNDGHDDDGEEEEDNSMCDESLVATSKEASMDRLKVFERACVHFLIGIATLHPLLVFLDDAQWAGEACIDFMTSMMSGVTGDAIGAGRAIQFVVSFRDGYGMRERLSALYVETGLIVDIPMKNFDVVDTTALVARLMSIPLPLATDQSQLGKIVHEKTGGNPFFIVQFFELAQIMEYITWNKDQLQMECTDIKGVVHLDVSDGVIASIDKRVYQLKPISRSVLMLAAHLGFEFHGNILVRVVQASPFGVHLSKSDASLLSTVKEVLEEAESHRLIIRKRKDSNSFVFMHDRVQQCFHEMMPMGTDKERLFLNIGRVLYKYLMDMDEHEDISMGSDELDDEHIMFITVDSLNAGRSLITSKKEQSDLLVLNVRVSDLSASKCSFAAAAGYLKVAIELIPTENAWTEHHDLSVQLHQKIAQMLCNSLQIEETHQTLDTIMRHARSLSDRQRAWHTRFDAYERKGQNDLAFSTALAALEELGVSNIQGKSSKIKVMWNFLRARTRLMLRWNLNDLLKLPTMRDERILATVQWLHITGQNCLIRGDNTLMMFCFIEAFQLSLIHGSTGFTPAATAAFGMLEFAITRNPDRAYEMGRIAVKMLDSFGDTDSYRAVTETFSSSSLLCWRDPLYDSIIPALERAYESGMRYGDTRFAQNGLVAASCGRLNLGRPLRQIEREMRQCISRIEEIGEGDTGHIVSLAHLQAVHNHMGLSDDPLILSGEVMSEEDILHNPNEEERGVGRISLLFLKFRLACHYRSLYNAASMLEELEKNKNTFFAFGTTFTTFQFFVCLTYLDLARKQTSGAREGRKYLARAKKAYKAMERIASGEKCYAAYLVGILEAELKFVTSKGRVMDRGLYDAAIEKALEGGFLSYAAIACERAAVALLQQNEGNHGRRSEVENDDDDSVVYEYLKQGLELNERWEAFAKVDWYRETFSAELDRD